MGCNAPSAASESDTARASKTLCTDRPLLRIASSKALTTASGSRSSACASLRMSSAALLRSTMVLSPAASSSSCDSTNSYDSYLRNLLTIQL